MGKYAAKTKKKKSPKQPIPLWVHLIRTVTVLATLAALFYLGRGFLERYVYMSGLKPVVLAGEKVDLRDSVLTVEDFEALAARSAAEEILWNVPISGSYYDSGAESIMLDKLAEDEVPYFAYFSNLKTVEAGKCRDHRALAALEKAYPELEVHWNIHLGGRQWSRDEKEVDLRRSELTVQELMDNLGYFAPGAKIQIENENITQEDRDALKEAFPELNLCWGVELMGKTWSSGETKLSFAGKKVDVEALIAAGPEFTALEELDLRGCDCTLEELVAIQEAFGGAAILAEIELYGQKLSPDVEEIDLSGIKMTDTSQVEAAAKLLPNLKKVIMSDCGISNEDMDALNKRHENIQFVWTVHFSVYSLRTDATAFCASNLPSHGYIAIKMNDAQIEPLKYCTELVALDLGHMRYTNLSFLENMTKLKYLVLVEANYSDISVLARMDQLYYLELFKNKLEDLTPLLQCKNLKHLNIGYTKGFDYAPLKEMTWLERLWFPGHSLSREQAQEIVDALPDTQVYVPAWDADGSTGGGWREADVYFEMRNLFDMFYQPGGTGTGKEN